ncbi:MAG TPA: hypothetical protein VKV27_02815 [Solirubrobacteraceae bacterium]|nr:hypothetical protein [Solirubrobacteraceae bacterium]
MPGSPLDEHLAEIDRRLAAIQSALQWPRAVPEPRSVPEQPTHLPEQPRGTPAEEREAPLVTATVCAGPFDGTEALARFEAGLRSLPGVRSLRLREYEGPDRVHYEVLIDPSL